MESRDYLSQVVAFLSREIGIRTCQDPEQLDRTARYIADQFSSFGYHVTRQPFSFSGNTYHNVIAELRGSRSPERIIVVGAHYDTVRTTFGADDNASGVAGLLDLARCLAGKPLKRTVRFVAFALEEPPVYRTANMGSYHYARSLREKQEQVDGMICLEMIGYFCDQDGSQHYPLPFMNLKYPGRGNFIAIVGNLASKGFTDSIAQGFSHGTDLPVITLNAPFFVLGIDFSDHWSFYQFGYRALMVTDTAFYRNPHYHAPSDLPQTLDYTGMAEVVAGLRKAIMEWGE
ncbi:MAG TPA: M28 family peptidase [Nitrospirota bacterium]|nr:M28 family peptidase [Nitrospirota bacterium]